MLLIAAALAEELETALSLCAGRRKGRYSGIPVWTGTRGEEVLHFVKLGVGPVRSASVLERILRQLPGARILVVGYAGALNPGLKQGDLVVVEEAHLLSKESWGAPLHELGLAGSWPLAGARELHSMASAAGMQLQRGAALTSSCIIGAPEHKKILVERFQAAVIDMETAALARVAASCGVPLDCVRAVSDEAQDDFLAPFSYYPGAGPLGRATRTIGAGRLIHRYSRWRERAAAARRSLRRFMTWYLDGGVWKRLS